MLIDQGPPIMRAVRFHAYGDVDVLRLEEVALPVPTADELRIKVHASSLNPADIGGRNG
jgi:NADPH:quinone reductase-like Zn-dependent oxidoreductase